MSFQSNGFQYPGFQMAPAVTVSRGITGVSIVPNINNVSIVLVENNVDIVPNINDVNIVLV